MAYNNEELQIIQYGAKNGKTRQEVEDAIKKYRSGYVPPKATTIQSPSVTETLKQRAVERADKVGEILARPDVSAPIKAIQTLGQGAGMASEAIEKPIMEIPGAKQASEAIGEGFAWLSQTAPIKAIGDVIGESKTLQEATQLYDTDPEFKDTIDAVGNLIRLGLDVQGVAESGAFAKNVTNKLAERAKNITPPKLPEAPEALKMAAERVSIYPERIKTNVIAKQNVTQRVAKLPTKTARDAARNGVEISDVEEFAKYSGKTPDSVTLSSENKARAKEMYEAAKAFSENKLAKDPAEIVGQPIVERLKLLESEKVKIGKRLGEIANNLGDVTQEEALQVVFDALQKTPGLSGLKMVKNAKTGKITLDFTDTTLASGMTQSDRSVIQSAFSDATKAGTGKQKHLYRQELFEVLGGKKKANIALTDTQDKAINSIRKGLSDLLESKNEGYKAESAAFRKVATPLEELKKMMRATSGMDEDVLNMKASNLARRLTSKASTKADVEYVLKLLDDAVPEKGVSFVSTRELQNFYNLLDKYYDIAGDTSFQGQITRGVEKIPGVMDVITEAAGKAVGRTSAVQRKALDDLLTDVFSSTAT